MSSKQPNPDSPSDHKEKSNPNEVLKYSGMAFQMAAIMGIGIFIGRKLDAYFGNEKPIMLLVCILFFGFAAFYVSLKDFFKTK